MIKGGATRIRLQKFKYRETKRCSSIHPNFCNPVNPNKEICMNVMPFIVQAYLQESAFSLVQYTAQLNWNGKTSAIWFL